MQGESRNQGKRNQDRRAQEKERQWLECGMAILLVAVLAFFGTRMAQGGETQDGGSGVQKKAEAENQEAREKGSGAPGAEESQTEDSQAGGAGQAPAGTEGQEVIASGQYPVMGASSVTVGQMVAFFESAGVPYPSAELSKGGADTIEAFCQMYYDEAAAEGVRAEVAFAQTMKETGWLQFGGDASIGQFNFAGLGTTGGGVPGNSYPDVRTGIRAQIQHLKAYATADALNQECVDDRYEYVLKGCAPYVEWLGQGENPEGTGWATAENYGFSIVDMINKMKAAQGSAAD